MAACIHVLYKKIVCPVSAPDFFVKGIKIKHKPVYMKKFNTGLFDWGFML